MSEIKNAFVVTYHGFTAKRKPFFTVSHDKKGKKTFRLSTFPAHLELASCYAEALKRFCQTHDIVGKFVAGRIAYNKMAFVPVDSDTTVTI